MRFQYECHDADGQWYRSYGNELWEFNPEGLMARREASINDVRIDESERRYFGAAARIGVRPGLSALVSPRVRPSPVRRRGGPLWREIYSVVIHVVIQLWVYWPR